MKLSEIPKFGNLENVHVLIHGNTVAAPFAGELMAENGARVICLENSKVPDMGRMGSDPFGFITEHRNEIALSLNLGTPEGNEVFLRLAKQLNIIIEGQKGGTYEKLGLSDEALWEVNPKLVIVHMSGFGQSGVPEYVNRPSYDPIGQAFGGYTYLNGEAGGGPIKANPYTADYMSALFACWSGLAAYIGAQATGKGESVDVTQFESMWKVQYNYPMHYFQFHELKQRSGNDEPLYIGLGRYPCKTGDCIFTVSGKGPVSRLTKVLGVEDDPDFKDMMIMMRQDPKAQRLDALLRQYCLQHDAEEVDKIMMENAIPCSQIHNVATMENNPHAIARELFVEWEDEQFGWCKAVNIVPKMKNRPGKYWRGAPGHNQDGKDILTELGYSEEEIAKLYADGVTGELPNRGFLRCKKIDRK